MQDILLDSNSNVCSMLPFTIFAVEIRMTLSLTFTTGKGKRKYVHRKPVYDFLFDDNVCPICYRVRDIQSRNVLTLTLTFRIDQGEM